MSTDPQRRDQRRGERVLIRVPIEVRGTGPNDRSVAQPGETAVVSRFGALLCIPAALKPGTKLTVTNGFPREAEEFRVVWVSEKRADNRWEVGVEALKPREDFWGIRFPPKQPGA